MKYSYNRCSLICILLNDVIIRIPPYHLKQYIIFTTLAFYTRFNKRSLESSSQRRRSRLITAQRIYNIYRINRERRITCHIRFAWDRTAIYDMIRYNVRGDLKCLKRRRAFPTYMPITAAHSRHAMDKTRSEK